MQPGLFNKAVLCAIGKIEKSTMAVKDGNTAHLYDKDVLVWYESYHLYSCPTSTLERQKWHITIADLQAMFIHGVAACNHIIVKPDSKIKYFHVCDPKYRFKLAYFVKL